MVTKRETKMTQTKTTPKNNSANQQNPNKGSKGANKAYDKNQGNRGKQKNPNQQKKGK